MMMNGDLAPFIPTLVQNIMVAFYKMNFQGRKILSPSLEQVKFFIGAAVRKVPNDDEFLGFEKKNAGKKPLKVFRVDALRYRDA